MLICIRCFLISFAKKDVWWLNEPTVETKLPLDVIASSNKLVILDVNGVSLKNFKQLPTLEEFGKHVPRKCKGLIVHVGHGVYCVVKLDAKEFLLNLKAKASIMIWSCCKKKK